MKSLVLAAGFFSAALCLPSSTSAQVQPYHQFGFQDLTDRGSAGTTLFPDGQVFQTTDRFGFPSGALYTANGNAYIEDGSGFQGSFTVTVWYRALQQQNAPYAGFWGFERPTAGPGITGYGLYSAFGFDQMEFEGGGKTTIATGAPLILDEWHRVSCVQDTAAKTRLIYVDGVRQDDSRAGTYTDAIPALNERLIIGRRSGQPASYRLYGSIDEFTVYDRALSDAQVDSTFRAEADLVAPSVPARVRASYLASVDDHFLSWDPASDDNAVEKYRVFVDGTEVNPAAVESFQARLGVPALAPGERITISVVSVDYSNNASDTATVVFPETSNTPEQRRAASALTLSPNPSEAGAVRIGGLSEPAEVRILSMTGQVLSRQTLSPNQRLDTSVLPASTYVVRLVSPAIGSTSLRLVVR